MNTIGAIEKMEEMKEMKQTLIPLSLAGVIGEYMYIKLMRAGIIMGLAHRKDEDVVSKTQQELSEVVSANETPVSETPVDEMPIDNVIDQHEAPSMDEAEHNMGPENYEWEPEADVSNYESEEEDTVSDLQDQLPINEDLFVNEDAEMYEQENENGFVQESELMQEDVSESDNMSQNDYADDEFADNAENEQTDDALVTPELNLEAISLPDDSAVLPDSVEDNTKELSEAEKEGDRFSEPQQEPAVDNTELEEAVPEKTTVTVPQNPVDEKPVFVPDNDDIDFNDLDGNGIDDEKETSELFNEIKAGDAKVMENIEPLHKVDNKDTEAQKEYKSIMDFFSTL